MELSHLRRDETAPKVGHPLYWRTHFIWGTRFFGVPG